jgi:CRISPR type I-A-associated protein Csa5
MITLYTPATGFPDLEVKIAYGLARVAIEAVGIEKVSIHNNGGFYSVIINISESECGKLDKTFNLVCKRLLSSEYIPLNTPGIKKSGKGGGFVGNITFKVDDNFSLNVYGHPFLMKKNEKDEPVCGHELEKVGTVLGLAAESGYHHSRDKLDSEPKKDRGRYYIGRPSSPKRLCKTCALLALLGMWYASFIFSVADKEVIVIPIPNQELTGSKLQEIFALQHRVRKEWFSQNIPQILIPLVFLSKIPSSADILEGFDLFVAVLSRQQGYHVDGIYLIEIANYLDFIRKTPYNIATIERMVNTFGNKKFSKEAYDSLIELNNALYYRAKDSLLKFARLYVFETTPKEGNWTNLLYSETTNYLLREVGMIPSNIIENPALQSLAKTLRYFIRERKYGYADDIRNARKNSRDFEETIAKMLREGELRRVQQEQDRQAGKEVKNWIYLPNEEEIKEVFRLANEDFESTKLALVMLAFSFPPKGTEEDIK